MLIKMLTSAVLLLFCGIFCASYSQSQEASIKLDTHEQIEEFKKMFEPENNAEVNLSDDLATALSAKTDNHPEKTNTLEDEFEVYKPQAKDEPDQSDKTGRSVKRLDSDEDLAEFEELLKKAQLN